MSIFSKFKSLFNKNIECGNELDGRIVYLYPLKGRIVNVNSHIIVNDGYAVVFVCNDKVCDVLPSGKHKISGVTLPISFNKLKLDKPNKHGNYQKKFKADVYYVSTQIISQQNFSSTIPFFAKSQKFGKIKGYTEGLVDIQISEPDKLLKVLLIDRPFVGNKEVNKLITDLIGNEVNSMLEHTNFSFNEIIINPKILIPYFNPAINNKCDAFGVRVYNLEVISLKLNRRLQKKVSEFLADRQQVETQFENTGIKFDTSTLVPNKVELNSNAEIGNSQTLAQNGNSQTLNTNSVNTSAAPQIIRRGGVNPVSTNENVYVDNKLNLEKDILSGNEKKVCKFCGETIDSSYSFCPKCGFKQ